MVRSLVPLQKLILRGAVAVAVSVLAVSCSESKTSQCNKLIEVANQAVTQVQSVTQNTDPSNANPNNVQAMSKIADAADQARSQMQALQISDSNLKAFQDRFVAMYTETSQATRELVAAANANNPENAQKSFNALKAATDKEGPLVEEVNRFCTKE